MITDLGHTALAAYDLEKSLAFYAQLEIHEAFRLHREDGSLMLVYLHIGGDRYIEIFPGGPAPTEDRVGSFKHICLLTDDLKRTVETLRQAGITIQREPKQGMDGNWQAWLRDPDGNDIELMQLEESSPQRKVARGELPSL